MKTVITIVFYMKSYLGTIVFTAFCRFEHINLWVGDLIFRPDQSLVKTTFVRYPLSFLRQKIEQRWLYKGHSVTSLKARFLGRSDPLKIAFLKKNLKLGRLLPGNGAVESAEIFTGVSHYYELVVE